MTTGIQGGFLAKSRHDDQMPTARPSPLTARLAKHALLPIRRWVLDIPFDWRAWSSAQGVTWDKVLQASVWTGPELPVELLPFAARPFSWEWRQQARANPGSHWSIPELAPLWKARPHQEQAAVAMAAALQRRRVGFLLADEVGVGKTMSAWSFALAEPALVRVLIVTTSAAIPHWRNTLLHAGHGGKDILILNYDRLGKVFDVSDRSDLSTRRKGKRKRIANKGEPEAFDLIIFDEAHKGKNLTSARSIMMRRLTARAQFVVWASATAGQNPLELAYLAPLLAQVTGQRLSALSADFEAWCKTQDIGVSRGQYGRWEWRRSKPALEKMRKWLFAGGTPAGIRRLPQEIDGWQAMERQMVPVGLDPEARRAYALAWAEFRREQMASPAPKTPAHSRQKAKAETGLVAQLRFRQKCSWIRIPTTLEQVADHLDNGKRVAVSVAFHETLEEMARNLRAAGIEPALIHGRQTPSEKEAQRLSFQKGQTPVVLFTVEEAISLHEGEFEDVSRVLLVHDLRWSALQMAQIEGRCHRDGKFAPTQWLFAEDSVEADIAQVLLGRVIAMKTMHGDDVSDLEAVEAALAARLLHEGPGRVAAEGAQRASA